MQEGPEPPDKGAASVWLILATVTPRDDYNVPLSSEPPKERRSMTLRVALLIATALVFTSVTLACGAEEEPQKEVTREFTKEVTVVQPAAEPKKGEVKKEEPKKEEPKKEEVKKEEVKKEEVKKEEVPKEGGKVGEPVKKFEDLPEEVKEKLPEEAKQEIKQELPAKAAPQ